MPLRGCLMTARSLYGESRGQQGYRAFSMAVTLMR
jgi:hypothetical protein